MSREELAQDYLDGQLSGAELARAEQLYRDNPEFRREVEYWRAWRQRFQELPRPELPAEFLDKVLMRVANEPSTRSTTAAEQMTAGRLAAPPRESSSQEPTSLRGEGARRPKWRGAAIGLAALAASLLLIVLWRFEPLMPLAQKTTVDAAGQFEDASGSQVANEEWEVPQRDQAKQVDSAVVVSGRDVLEGGPGTRGPEAAAEQSVMRSAGGRTASEGEVAAAPALRNSPAQMARSADSRREITDQVTESNGASMDALGVENRSLAQDARNRLDQASGKALRSEPQLAESELAAKARREAPGAPSVAPQMLVEADSTRVPDGGQPLSAAAEEVLQRRGIPGGGGEALNSAAGGGMGGDGLGGVGIAAAPGDLAQPAMPSRADGPPNSANDPSAIESQQAQLNARVSGDSRLSTAERLWSVAGRTRDLPLWGTAILNPPPALDLNAWRAELENQLAPVDRDALSREWSGTLTHNSTPEPGSVAEPQPELLAQNDKALETGGLKTGALREAPLMKAAPTPAPTQANRDVEFNRAVRSAEKLSAEKLSAGTSSAEPAPVAIDMFFVQMNPQQWELLQQQMGAAAEWGYWELATSDPRGLVYRGTVADWNGELNRLGSGQPIPAPVDRVANRQAPAQDQGGQPASEAIPLESPSHSEFGQTPPQWTYLGSVSWEQLQRDLRQRRMAATARQALLRQALSTRALSEGYLLESAESRAADSAAVPLVANPPEKPRTAETRPAAAPPAGGETAGPESGLLLLIPRTHLRDLNR